MRFVSPPCVGEGPREWFAMDDDDDTGDANLGEDA
jgi:hypothetical protein